MKSSRPARPVYDYFSLIKFHFFKAMASLSAAVGVLGGGTCELRNKDLIGTQHRDRIGTLTSQNTDPNRQFMKFNRKWVKN